MWAAFTTSTTLLFSVVLHAPVLPVSSFQSIPSMSIALNFASRYRITTTSHFVQRRTTTTAIMMSSTSPAAVTKLTDITSIFGGGDYAGLFATFSSETGKLVSVPEHQGENRYSVFNDVYCICISVS